MNNKNRCKPLLLLCFLIFQGCSDKQQDNNVIEDHKYSVMMLYPIIVSIEDKEIALASEKGDKELGSTLSAIKEFNGNLIDQAGGISAEGYFPAIADPHNNGIVALRLMEMYKFQSLFESYLSHQLLNGRIDKEQYNSLISILHNYLDKDKGILTPDIIKGANISDVIVHIFLLEMWLMDL